MDIGYILTINMLRNQGVMNVSLDRIYFNSSILLVVSSRMPARTRLNLPQLIALLPSGQHL